MTLGLACTADGRAFLTPVYKRGESVALLAKNTVISAIAQTNVPSAKTSREGRSRNLKLSGEINNGLIFR